MIESILMTIILLLIMYIFYSKTRHSKELRAVAKKLDNLMDHPTPILFHSTNNSSLQVLLVEINRLLRNKQKNKIAYKQKEMSMRKMLTNISHDLRTPLTVVLGLSESILHRPDMDLNERTRSSIKLIHNKSEEIVHLINRFFELVRLESDDQEISLEKINISEVCKRSVLTFYQQVESRGLTMALELLDQPVYGLANEEALIRVLENLMSNAIRHGYEGKVIGMTLREENQYVSIDVWDRGKGIQEQEKERVFERLHMEDKFEAYQKKGSGLGLNIVHQLVKKMQGNIRINSVPYEKTTITVKLLRV
ncbi:sensor histidine kinase [Bacillus carboniphilus]|uniref:histidine kinase n=1 Tax=Bacillus carboniphilus TaxID=86663 RepID=A0ABY9K0P1_9BACI|nr:sensor histidine kinase [Bacillus carboniphilus]WLR43415.1 sensor histidine kinase [Bacillus carboniphilus]